VAGFSPEDIVGTTQPFVTTPGMLVRHPEPVCHANKLRWYLQNQGHSEGLYHQNMAFCFIFLTDDCTSQTEFLEKATLSCENI